MTSNPIAKWDIFEAGFSGPSDGNPFVDVSFEAVFAFGGRRIPVPGFYDGEGVYRVRFMPDTEGEWSFRTRSNAKELDGREGAFVCAAPREGMHGPVSVRNQFHFAHADGTPFLPFGTTCYAWTHQPLDMQAQTLRTLEKTGFNKIRMCVFPKHYVHNENEPLFPVFEIGPDGKEDFDRPNVVMFRHFETRIAALRELGIEADIIIFHPYDRWGYANMGLERDLRYIRYLAARIASYANVWWSLANEYDFLIDCKPVAQWDRYFHAVEEHDPYRHLKSIHNGRPADMYNHRKPWVDHVCVQDRDIEHTADWRKNWGKPIVNDELEYEGNIERAWGCISAREMVHRFWTTVMRGGYAGHGETYAHPEDLLWWAKGGELRGESWKRIAFMRDLLEEDVKNGLTPFMPENGFREFARVAGGYDGDARYVYFGAHQPVIWAAGFPKEDGDYEIDLIDTWEMTVTPLEKGPLPKLPPQRGPQGIIHAGPDAAFGVRLPGKPYQAIRVRPRR